MSAPRSVHLVQLFDGSHRRVALVAEPDLLCLSGLASVYELVRHCLSTGQPIAGYAQEMATGERLPYDAVYAGSSPWRLLPPIDVPGEPSRLMLSGTGLTHLGSARERQAMHLAEPYAALPTDAVVTDSMRMFRWGVDAGRPARGTVGIAPEWFFKGDASSLRAPFEPLTIPSHAEDGGEEAELAGVYIIAADGTPVRLGMTQANEFSDHRFEQRNYLNLAGSKLRECSLGPELVVGSGAPFTDVRGQVSLTRDGATLWEKKIASGEENMCHSLANLEHHHFKFAGHRQPGAVHVHFFGADALSFGAGVTLKTGDVAEVRFEGYGRALRNPIVREAPSNIPVQVRSLA